MHARLHEALLKPGENGSGMVRRVGDPPPVVSGVMAAVLVPLPALVFLSFLIGVINEFEVFTLPRVQWAWLHVCWFFPGTRSDAGAHVSCWRLRMFELAARQRYSPTCWRNEYRRAGRGVGVVGADVAVLMRDCGPRGGVVAWVEDSCGDLEQAGVPHSASVSTRVPSWSGGLRAGTRGVSLFPRSWACRGCCKTGGGGRRLPEPSRLADGRLADDVAMGEDLAGFAAQIRAQPQVPDPLEMSDGNRGVWVEG